MDSSVVLLMMNILLSQTWIELQKAIVDKYSQLKIVNVGEEGGEARMLHRPLFDKISVATGGNYHSIPSFCNPGPPPAVKPPLSPVCLSVNQKEYKALFFI